MGNLVAIVGRPNVGKSTLFNRLTETKQAIISDVAGTTRDRQYGRCQWCGKEFSLVDTGGWVRNSDDVFEEAICDQVTLALEEADVILFVVDSMNGLTDLDMEMASMLRRSKKPVLVVANKVDTYEMQYATAEFYSLGLGDMHCISAANGSGTGDLLDTIIANFTKDAEEQPEENIPRFAVVGRPNAGKSSLINMLTNRKQLAKTSSTPGKTITINHFLINNEWHLVDLPGYGFAQRSKKDREAWKKMLDEYIKNRKNLVSMFVLVDSRIEPQKIDLEFISHLGELQMPFSIIFTKVDKIKEVELQRNVQVYKDKLAEQWEELPPIFITSSEKEVGKDDVLNMIDGLNEQLKGSF